MEPEDKVANIGNNRKKHNKKKTKNTGGAIIIGIVFVAVIILLLIFLLQGKTTTSGNYPDNVSDKALSCIATNIDYPFFVYDNSYKKEYGARPMRRYIEKYIEDGLASKFISNELRSGQTAFVSVDGDKLVIDVR